MTLLQLSRFRTNVFPPVARPLARYFPAYLKIQHSASVTQTWVLETIMLP